LPRAVVRNESARLLALSRAWLGSEDHPDEIWLTTNKVPVKPSRKAANNAPGKTAKKVVREVG
jgi:hypothetical protein